MANDTNFDDVFERFERNIKNNNKGFLRDTLIREDLQEWALPAQGGSLTILDGGCGLGDVSVWLAEQGHEVFAYDISAKMVARTQQRAQELGLSERLHVEQRAVQDVLRETAQQFDVICIHSVMEWLSDPFALLPLVERGLKPGAYLSITAYNLHRAVFNSLVNGSFRKILRGDFSGSKRTLTPPNPLEPEQLLQSLSELGLKVELYAGLRCFYDYFKGYNIEAFSLEDVLTLERRYRKTSPYREMARYIHVLARKL